MALGIDTIDEPGLSNEARREEEEGNAVFAVHYMVKPFNQLYIY